MSTIDSPWFTGSVMEAVNLATTKNVIFMVYIYDENEESQQMNNITENSNSAKTIKDKTVALRISRDSEEAIMFGQLFTITKVPSIYLIRVGAVRDYIPGVVSEENLISRINTVASLNLSIPTSTSLPVSPPVVSSISPPTPSPPQQQSSSSTTSTLTAPSNSSFQTQTSENSNDNLISRTARIQSKIEEKRKKREQEQKRAEKEREINRRTQGKAMQDVYRQQNEAKTKKIADEFAKQKKDEEEAKRRIREQIALDKAERQAKRQAELSLRQQLQQEEEQQEIFSKNDKVGIINGSYNHSNISVRLLNGDIVRKKFQSTQTLEDVKTWIEEDRTDGKAPYNLIQNFPHRQFGINDETKSLKELNLCPSGTLICKPSKNVSIAYSSDGGFVWNFFSLGFSMIGTLLSYINPFYYFYSGNSQQQRRQFRNSNNERHLPNNNSNQSDNHNNDDIINNTNNNNNNNSSSSKSSERRNYGGNNVRTLSQNDDDIDKRWTYNGNSTNQE